MLYRLIFTKKQSTSLSFKQREITELKTAQGKPNLKKQLVEDIADKINHLLITHWSREMTDTKKKPIETQTTIISGKKVKVASPQDTKISSNKMKSQYSKALENLKNR